MTCAESSCGKSVFNKRTGLCGMHYYRLLRNGSTTRLITQERARNWHIRFWSKVRPSGDCWEWQGTKDSYGYGVFMLSVPKRKMVKAHRLAYEFMVCDIPDGLTIDHLCRNKLCVNPDHLDPVPNDVNARRATERVSA